MIRNRALPFLGECYADEARPFSSQDVCNWLPAAAEKPGTLTPEMAQTPPGLSPFVEIPGTGGGETPYIPSKPVRGTYNCEGKLFSVIGNRLYQISNSGVAIPLGTVPGVTRTRFAHNQITNGNQLVTVNGSAGYVYDTPTQVFERITDPGYPGAITADFVDGYIVSIEPGRRFAFNSDLANAREYNTLDRFTSEYKPDLLVTQVVSNNELILLSESSGEVFYNSGAAQQPFRTKRVFFDKGCSGRCNAAVIDNSFVFHSSDGMFYLYEGGVPKRISTRPIEQAVAGLNWAQGFAEVWIDGGHSVVYWTFPGGHTWGWDASSGKWHRRASYGMDRWRINTLTRWTKSAPGMRDEWIAGDFQTGRLWRLDWDYLLEGHDEFVSEIVGVVLSDNQNPLTMPRLEVMLDTGQELTVPRDFPEQPPSPSITGTAPDGVRLLPYGSYTYPTTGGTGVLTITRRPGSVDIPGLTFDNGTWTGTPLTEFTEIGYVDYQQTIRVTDENGLWSEITDTIRITAALLGFATENYLFTGPPSALVESIPTGMLGITPRSISITPNSLYIAAGSVNPPWLIVKKRREDGTGYNAVSAFDDMPTDDISSTAFSPDGQYFACLQSTGVITLRVYKIGETTFDLVDSVTHPSSNLGLISWSPDSSRIAVPVDLDPPKNGMSVYPFDKDTETLGTPVHANTVSNAATPIRLNWDPSGSFLAEESGGNLAIWDARVDPILLVDKSLISGPTSEHGALWSGDGDYVYTVGGTPSGGNFVAIFGWSGSSLSAPVYPADQPPTFPLDSSTSADGGSLAIGMSTHSPSVYVYEVLGSDLEAYPAQPTTSQNVTGNVVFTGSGLSE